MAKMLNQYYYSILFMILSLFMMTIPSFAEARRLTSSGHHRSFSTKLSAKAMALKNEKLTHLHFYYHNLLAGPNVTAVPLNPKGPLDFNDTAALFGRLTMTDNPMTLGPELNSTTVGRVRGMYGVASRTEVAFVMMMSFVFADDQEYGGSTIDVLGHNPMMAAGIKEMPVVGGSGVFRFARGYGDTKVISLNATTGNAVVEWDLYVFHY